MYAKTIAIHAARTQAWSMIGRWLELSWGPVTEEEHGRAREMAQLWELVAQHLDRQVKRKTKCICIVTRPDIKAVADALVRTQSEIAYKVDHG
jgi:hypothetical protein